MSEQQNKGECKHDKLSVLETKSGTYKNCMLCGTFFIDSRTPEERANEPETTMTTTSPLTMEERLIKTFSLEFFASQDWEYDYKNSPSEFKFMSWQEKFTNIAKTKQDMVAKFIKSEISSAVSQALKEQREEMIENIKNISWEDMKCDCNMCYAYEKAISRVLGLLSNNKE